MMDNNSTTKYVSMELITPKSKKTTQEQTRPATLLEHKPDELDKSSYVRRTEDDRKDAGNVVEASTKKTRLVTDTKSWLTNVTNRKINLYDQAVQWSCLTNTVEYPIIERQILNKIRGYKSQDMEKGIYQEELFVTYPYVYALIQEYKMQCYYCKESTMILYECVREPKQWTLERIDNSTGHNCGNVQIACLQCNLRRRTMFQEKYVLTKQMMIVTKLDASTSFSASSGSN